MISLRKLSDFMLHSVRGRIVAGVVVLQAVLMGLVAFDMVSRRQNFMQMRLAQEGRGLAQTLAADTVSKLIGNDSSGIGEMPDSLKSVNSRSQHPLRFAIVLDMQGKVRTFGDSALFDSRLDDPAGKQVLAALNGGASGGRYQFWHDGMVDSFNEITAGGRRIGYARVLLDAAPMRSELDAAVRQAVAYMLAAVLLGGLIAWWLGRTLSRRLDLLSRAAGEIAAGNLLISLPLTSGKDEISRLTRDFAGMARALEGNIAAHERVQASLFEEKERALVTLNSIGDAVITTDTNGNVTFLNPVAENMTGWSTGEAQDQPLETVFRIIDETTRKTVANPVARALRDNCIVGLSHHTVLVRRDGKELHIEDSAAPIRDSLGGIIGVVLVFSDVSEKRMLAMQLSYQARHDSLTGLVNRGEFELSLSKLIADATALHRSHALLYLDLDQFKVINDTCGHSAGDLLLREIADLLKIKVRNSDTLARLGGDEFGVLLENCPKEKARSIAQELLETIKAFRFDWEEKSFTIGASIGLVEITDDSGNAARMLSAADTACYAAKDMGRNQVQIFQPDNEEMVRRHGEMHWVARIAKAFEEERFMLYYQPIVPLASDDRDAEHIEILIRLLDENNRMVPPGSFIPAAERYNLMRSIDRWVVTNTFTWLTANPERNIICAVNLSGQSIGDDQFLHFLFNLFKSTGVAPGKICFEITETAAISNIGKAGDFIGELKAIGCRFSLDDFGSGLSSFSYLKNLPVDYLKIDGIFVKDMERAPIDCAMVEAINNIGHVMGIKTIAEYVENDAIFAKIQAIGVDYAQGFGISKPAPLSCASPAKARTAELST